MKASQDPHASYVLIKGEMSRRGYDSRMVELGDMRMVEFTHPRRNTWMTEINHMRYPLIDGSAAKIANNKSLSYELVERLGIPVPYTRTVAGEEVISEQEGADLIRKYGQLIVKPQQASLSNGLTLGITNMSTLLSAISNAREFDKGDGSVLIQQQIQGEEVRFTVLNGTVVAALLRQTPRVVGDGVTTVAQLIRAENDDRAKIVDSLAGYPLLSEENIDLNLLMSEVILEKGEILELSRATMIKDGASVYNVLPEVHPSYVDIAKKSATALGARYLVVDIFIDDYTRAHTPGTAYFNEFNVAPVLKLFYSCRDGRHVDIVPPLVDAIDGRLR